MPSRVIRVLFLIGLLFAIALAYPLVNESTASSCSAFEKVAFRESIRQEVDHGRLSSRDAPLVSLFGRTLQEASHGAFTAALIKVKHPNFEEDVEEAKIAHGIHEEEEAA